MSTFRWGILGTGAIAAKFVEGLAVVDDAVAAAVGSRSPEGALRFAAAHGIARAHGTYDALAADPEVDAVYVATPHHRHRADTLLCLDAGKHVLCEKPFALNASQSAEMIARARERGLFLMEAMWMRFNPVVLRALELVHGGAIGAPRWLQADFGFRAEFDAGGRLFAPELAGGALLDVGVYCVSLAHLVFDAEPEAVTSLAQLGATGVDEQSTFALRFPGGGLAVSSCAVRTNTPQEATLCGAAGTLRIPTFWSPDRLVVNGAEERFELGGNGYHFEALEVARRVRAGDLESPGMPLDETLAIMRTLDRIREPWGLIYPGER
jgi:predicted dehydrogenase